MIVFTVPQVFCAKCGSPLVSHAVDAKHGTIHAYHVGLHCSDTGKTGIMSLPVLALHEVPQPTLSFEDSKHDN